MGSQGGCEGFVKIQNISGDGGSGRGGGGFMADVNEKLKN